MMPVKRRSERKRTRRREDSIEARLLIKKATLRLLNVAWLVVEGEGAVRGNVWLDAHERGP